MIELNGRIGGGVPEMLADATGVQLLPIALRIALGETIVFDAHARAARRSAICCMFRRLAWMHDP